MGSSRDYMCVLPINKIHKSSYGNEYIICVELREISPWLFCDNILPVKQAVKKESLVLTWGSEVGAVVVEEHKRLVGLMREGESDLCDRLACNVLNADHKLWA